MLNLAWRVLLMGGLKLSRIASRARGSQTVPRPYLRILGSDEPGKIDQHFGLLPGRIVLHLAVDHYRAGPVRHGIDDFLGETNLRRIRREHAFRDRHLGWVQRPSPDAAHDEGVAELGLARFLIVEVAEWTVKWLDARRSAGIDHLGQGVVP